MSEPENFNTGLQSLKSDLHSAQRKIKKINKKNHVFLKKINSWTVYGVHEFMCQTGK